MSTMHQDECRSHGKTSRELSTEHTFNTTMITLKGHPKGIFISDKQGAKTASNLWIQPLDSTGQAETHWHGKRLNSSAAGTETIHHSTDAELVRKEQKDYVHKLATITWTSGKELARKRHQRRTLRLGLSHP